MKRSRDIRWLLNTLSGFGVFIDYSLHDRYGQTVMIYDAQGIPRVMNLGTAKAAALDLERREWWG